MTRDEFATCLHDLQTGYSWLSAADLRIPPGWLVLLEMLALGLSDQMPDGVVLDRACERHGRLELTWAGVPEWCDNAALLLEHADSQAAAVCLLCGAWAEPHSTGLRCRRHRGLMLDAALARDADWPSATRPTLNDMQPANLTVTELREITHLWCSGELPVVRAAALLGDWIESTESQLRSFALFFRTEPFVDQGDRGKSGSGDPGGP
jgi:hypothetical protein